MATNFSACKGSYVSNQLPSNVMFGMNGFHVSASGAIQGHHGLLVSIADSMIKCFLRNIHSNLYFTIQSSVLMPSEREGSFANIVKQGGNAANPKMPFT